MASRGAKPGVSASLVIRAEMLARALTGVRDARVDAAPNGRITAVHVIPETGYSPQRVTQNVRSGLMAATGIALEAGRIYIVASLPDAPTASRPAETSDTASHTHEPVAAVEESPRTLDRTADQPVEVSTDRRVDSAAVVVRYAEPPAIMAAPGPAFPPASVEPVTHASAAPAAEEPDEADTVAPAVDASAADQRAADTRATDIRPLDDRVLAAEYASIPHPLREAAPERPDPIAPTNDAAPRHEPLPPFVQAPSGNGNGTRTDAPNRQTDARWPVFSHSGDSPRIELLEMQRDETGAPRCRVVIETDGRRRLGTATNKRGSETTADLIAGAILDALEPSIPCDLHFDGMADVIIAGQRHVVVSLRDTSDWSHALSGAAPVYDAVEHAIATAILNAIGIGIAHKFSTLNRLVSHR